MNRTAIHQLRDEGRQSNQRSRPAAAGSGPKFLRCRREVLTSSAPSPRRWTTRVTKGPTECDSTCSHSDGKSMYPCLICVAMQYLSRNPDCGRIPARMNSMQEHAYTTRGLERHSFRLVKPSLRGRGQAKPWHTIVQKLVHQPPVRIVVVVHRVGVWRSPVGQIELLTRRIG